MYSQRMDAINNEGIITCYRPYVDFKTGETKLRAVKLEYDRSQLMHLTDEQFNAELNRKLRELDAEFERSRNGNQAYHGQYRPAQRNRA